MARTEARIKTTIWSDPDFLALSHGAQWMYHLILEQPELSLCGVAAVTVGRWSSRSISTTPDDIRTFLKELEEARYIVVDEETEEVWVRTFIKNDGVLDSPNALVGMTNDFIGICSQAIREGVAKGLPEGFPQGVKEDVRKRIKDAFIQGYTRACARTASTTTASTAFGVADDDGGLSRVTVSAGRF